MIELNRLSQFVTGFAFDFQLLELFPENQLSPVVEPVEMDLFKIAVR